MFYLLSKLLHIGLWYHILLPRGSLLVSKFCILSRKTMDGFSVVRMKQYIMTPLKGESKTSILANYEVEEKILLFLSILTPRGINLLNKTIQLHWPIWFFHLFNQTRASKDHVVGYNLPSSCKEHYPIVMWGFVSLQMLSQISSISQWSVLICTSLNLPFILAAWCFFHKDSLSPPEKGLIPSDTVLYILLTFSCETKYH